MAKPKWHHMLEESKRQALVALDAYNSSNGHYSDFIVHMHLAWLYLLHAEFRRDGTSYTYIDAATGKPKLVEGEPKTWELSACLGKRFPSNDAVRRNIELFVALRNRVEHRFERALQVVTGGRAHALVINYETERVEKFGPGYSLAMKLRFPITLQCMTDDGKEELRQVSRSLPRGTSAFIARYDAGLDAGVLDDPRYDYRVRLVPMLGPKSQADLAIDFVNLDGLDEEDRSRLVHAGRDGTVITKLKHVSVSSLGNMPAKRAASRVEERLPFKFTVNHHTQVWRQLQVRPPAGAKDPRATDPRYCMYSDSFGQYEYTPAWIDRLVRELGTIEGYRKHLGRDPVLKPKATTAAR